MPHKRRIGRGDQARVGRAAPPGYVDSTDRAADGNRESAASPAAASRPSARAILSVNWEPEPVVCDAFVEWKRPLRPSKVRRHPRTPPLGRLRCPAIVTLYANLGQWAHRPPMRHPANCWSRSCGPEGRRTRRGACWGNLAAPATLTLTGSKSTNHALNVAQR